MALPELESKTREYLALVEAVRIEACQAIPADSFMRSTLLGIERRDSSIFGCFRTLLGRDKHLWMWAPKSLSMLLRQIGYREVYECKFREGRLGEVAMLDLESRCDESFYVEAVK